MDKVKDKNVMPAEGEGIEAEHIETAEAVKEATGSIEETECIETAENADNICACCHHKNTPRDPKEQKLLHNRLNRIIGQLNGIKSMIDDNRYCGDILIQIGAVESALQSLGYIILEDHMRTCVAEEVRRGNETILTEVVELVRRMK